MSGLSNAELSDHSLRIALLQPQIAPNTGNIARLCVATGTELHLVRPLGFVLSDRNLRRSAMDYWPRLRITIHDDVSTFLRACEGQTIHLFTSKSDRSLWQTKFQNGDWLIFGSESRGIDQNIRDRFPGASVRIPQAPGERCLNLSTAAGIGLYEAIRQVNSIDQRQA